MNPLLSREFVIPFDKIDAVSVERGVDTALAQARADLAALLTDDRPPTYATTLQALDDLTERLGRAMTLAYHLVSVTTTPPLRAAFNAALPAYSAFFAQLPLNEQLWQLLKTYADTPEAKALQGVKKRHLDKTLQEFRRAGADLDPDAKARVEQVQVELSRLQTKFSENVLDATNAYELVVTDETRLSGLPDSVKAQAKADAAAKNKEGWRFTLQAPSYTPFMKFADARDLRRELYEAFVSRASTGDLDNRPNIDKILALRKELATLLGYRDFADYRLETNMVKSGDAALAFERDLFDKTLEHWQQEKDALTGFAATLGLDDLQPYDLAYLTEKLRKARYDLDEEELRPYFPLQQVLSGLFDIAGRLFGVTVSRRDNAQVWHEDVEFYDLHDEAGTHLGSFYADWFPRESKQGGAWKNGFIIGGPLEDGSDPHAFDPHLAVIVANFTPPQEGKPALLTHREVQTIFHEFGHLLHHALSRVTVRARGATNVPRDWVELPSQIMENWIWERDALNLFARHFETGEPIPDALFAKMTAAQTFMEASAQVRQLSLGTIDLLLHTSYNQERDGDVVAFANRTMEPFVLRPEFAHNSFLTAFSHVFAGGYAASYYSYKWSEVLDADAFSRFKAEGIFNRETGRDYAEAVLSRGDSEDPAELFREFMGRDPDAAALIERNLGPLEGVPS